MIKTPEEVIILILILFFLFNFFKTIIKTMINTFKYGFYENDEYEEKPYNNVNPNKRRKGNVYIHLTNPNELEKTFERGRRNM